MAAIARFISYDGGIAFSERSLKIQRRSEAQGRIIPVSEIAALEVWEPQYGDDGCLRVRLVRERTASEENAVYFDGEQYAEAIRFKKAFDAQKSRSRAASIPMERVPARRPAGQQPLQQPETRPYRAKKPRTGRKARLKKLLLGVLGGYAVLLAIGGISLLFGNGPEKDMAVDSTPAAVSEAWQQPANTPTATKPAATAAPTPQPTVPSTPQPAATSAPDAFDFLKKAMAAGGQSGEGAHITNITLADRDLQISVDCTDPAYFSNYDDSVLLADSDRVVEPILGLGEQYDSLWDSMTVDYGVYGKVVKHKSDVVFQSSGSGGTSDRRYFAPSSETVVHDVPVPQAVSSAGAAAGSGAALSGSHASPPKVTDPPVTAPPEQRTEALVWIPTKGGKRYHKTSTCSGMNGPIQVTVSEAINRGFTPCQKCY